MQVSALEGHRVWAPQYDSAPNPLLALEARILTGVLGPVRGKLAIDVACGTGRCTARLRELGAAALGIDFCTEMLAEAEQKPELRGRVAAADAEILPFPNSIADLVLCSFAASYFESLPSVIREMARITRRGGRVILTDLHPAAATEGWTRSFRASGLLYEMRHSNPSLEDLRKPKVPGLHLVAQIETCFGEPERVIFRAAGKEASFAKLARIPALWTGVWKKR
jgi:SAM-dependent methyltransferase